MSFAYYYVLTCLILSGASVAYFIFISDIERALSGLFLCAAQLALLHHIVRSEMRANIRKGKRKQDNRT